MSQTSRELPGYAFYHDLTDIPTKESSKLGTASSSEKPSMIFEGSASGAPATFLADSGATHCFCDKSSAKTYGFKRQAANNDVNFADGSTQASTAQTALYLKIQGHTTSVQCYIIDMQGQFDVILGDTWLNKAGAVIDYPNKTCTVQRKGLKHTLIPMKQDTPPSSSHVNSLLLNALQVKRCVRQGARSFMVRVTDSGIQPDTDSTLSPEMQGLIDEFKDVFSPIQDLRIYGYGLSPKSKRMTS